MLLNVIVLPDGTEISSGPGETNAIMSVTTTESVNVGQELAIGSVFSNILEATILTPGGGINIAAGDEVTLYKTDQKGKRTRIGIYIMEKPTRQSANTIKITGYDRVIKLDKDLTSWLEGLNGWPYKLGTFAQMVCNACGLALIASEIPNKDFQVNQFTKSGVTGRQILRWIAEIACRFCRATPEGDIEFAWYRPSGMTITPGGNPRYFANSLKYDTFKVSPVDAVQLRLAESSSGALWPPMEAKNPYAIAGNAILLAKVTEHLIPYLEVIAQELEGFSYTPCKLSIPATMELRAGHTVDITDANGNKITAIVMTKTTTGQRDTLECTGSHMRSDSTAKNNRTQEQIVQDAINNQTHEDIFNKLTKNGEIQGIYVQDGKWYINAEFAKIINLVVSVLRAVEENENGFSSIIEAQKGRLRIFGDDGTGEQELVDIVAEQSEYGDYGAITVKSKFPAGETWQLLISGEGIVKTVNGEEVSRYLEDSFTLAGTGYAAPLMRLTPEKLFFMKNDIEASFGMDAQGGYAQIASIYPTGDGNMEWKYIDAIGETVLVKKT